jgi:hypothetical protein
MDDTVLPAYAREPYRKHRQFRQNLSDTPIETVTRLTHAMPNCDVGLSEENNLGLSSTEARFSDRKDPLAHLPHGARASTVEGSFDLSVPTSALGVSM